MPTIRSHSNTTLAATRMNYLVQVNVIGTSNPVVTRLLSIPSTATFEGLHHAIEAALGWNGSEYEDGVYSFKVIDGDPFIDERDDHTNSLLAIYEYDSENRGYHSIGDASAVELQRVFDSYKYREHDLRYTYNGQLEGPTHVLQVLGRSAFTTGAEVVCLGGQGHISLRVWLRSEQSGAAILSAWDLNLDKVNERMAKLKD